MGVSKLIDSGNIVGAFVYENYTPARCGVVLEDLGLCEGSSYFHKLRVKYIKGEIKVIASSQLQDFEKLIEERKRQYEVHAAKLEILKQIKRDSA